MAIFHCQFKNISRSDNRSAVACASYRSGSELRDNYYDRTVNYEHKEVAHSEILLPDNCPQEYTNREVL